MNETTSYIKKKKIIFAFITLNKILSFQLFKAVWKINDFLVKLVLLSPGNGNARCIKKCRFSCESSTFRWQHGKSPFWLPRELSEASEGSKENSLDSAIVAVHALELFLNKWYWVTLVELQSAVCRLRNCYLWNLLEKTDKPLLF